MFVSQSCFAQAKGGDGYNPSYEAEPISNGLFVDELVHGTLQASWAPHYFLFHWLSPLYLVGLGLAEAQELAVIAPLLALRKLVQEGIIFFLCDFTGATFTAHYGWQLKGCHLGLAA